MAATAAQNLAAILAAARTGRVTPTSARKWARRAAQGHSIAVLAQMTPAAERPTRAAMAALATDVAVILTSASAPGSPSPGPGELDDATADSLWPPRTAADAERRHQAVEAAATAAGLLADDELHSLLFGDHQFAAGGAEAAASPGHQAFTGQHIHQHPAYQQGDSGAKHSHPHTHAGDRNHDHHSGQ